MSKWVSEYQCTSVVYQCTSVPVYQCNTLFHCWCNTLLVHWYSLPPTCCMHFTLLTLNSLYWIVCIDVQMYTLVLVYPDSRYVVLAT